VTAVAAREPEPTTRDRPGPAMAGALAALALIAIDVAAVPAALPSVRLDLGSSSSGVVWVQEAHLLALAVALVLLLLPGARVDRRLLTALGVPAFAGGALLAATADSTAVIVIGRVLQGAATAALLVPALEALRPPAGGPRRALVPVGGGALAALALAPLVGGALAEAASWRWLFGAELALAVPALLLLAAERPGGRPEGGRSERPLSGHRAESERPSHGRRTAALAAGLVLLATGLVQSGPWGWASADTILLLAGGAALLGFARSEWPNRADAAVLVLAGSLAAALLLAPQYLELVRGLSPLRSGLLTAVLTLSAAGLAASGRLLAGRIPPRLSAVGGSACATLGAIGMTRIDPASSYALVVVSLGLLGSGIGAAAGALAVRAEGARLAAVAAQGAALVLAAAGALLQRAQLEEREAGGSFEDALAAGLASTGWMLAALLAGATLVAWRRASPPATRQAGVVSRARY
jgi:MFS family permease